MSVLYIKSISNGAHMFRPINYINNQSLNLLASVALGDKPTPTAIEYNTTVIIKSLGGSKYVAKAAPSDIDRNIIVPFLDAQTLENYDQALRHPQANVTNRSSGPFFSVHIRSVSPQLNDNIHVVVMDKRRMLHKCNPINTSPTGS
jgi:hypothetical protein